MTNAGITRPIYYNDAGFNVSDTTEEEILIRLHNKVTQILQPIRRRLVFHLNATRLTWKIVFMWDCRARRGEIIYHLFHALNSS